MIDSTRPVTITKSGYDVVTQGESPLQIFSFGKVLLLRDDHCIVRVLNTGKKINMPLTFPATVDGVVYHVDVPESEAAAPVDVADKPKKAGPKRGEGPTKMDLCKAIFAEYVGKDFTKSEVIARFIAEAGCTPAGANTYFLTCRKG